jgi:hypothetical protein
MKPHLTPTWKLKQKTHIQKLFVFLKTYSKPTIISWNLKINAN